MRTSITSFFACIWCIDCNWRFWWCIWCWCGCWWQLFVCAGRNFRPSISGWIFTGNIKREHTRLILLLIWPLLTQHDMCICFFVCFPSSPFNKRGFSVDFSVAYYTQNKISAIEQVCGCWISYYRIRPCLLYRTRFLKILLSLMIWYSTILLSHTSSRSWHMLCQSINCWRRLLQTAETFW